VVLKEGFLQIGTAEPSAPQAVSITESQCLQSEEGDLVQRCRNSYSSECV